METYLTQITNYLLIQSWQIAVLVTVMAVAAWALRNRSAHIRYLLWLIVLAKCLAPPLLRVPVAVLPERTPNPAAVVTPVPTVVEAAPETTTSAKPLSLGSPLAYSRPELSTHQWLAIGWLIGMLAFTCMMVVKAYRTVRWVHRDRKPLPRDVQNVINSLFVSLNLRKLPRMWLLDGIGQPFVWGALRGDIYLPAAFVRIGNDEHRRHILGHELSHVMRFDAAVNLLQTIAQTVFWFHPLVWWANRRIRAEREKCCDEMTIAHFAAKAKDYSKAIVDTLTNEYKSNRPLPSLAIAGPIQSIEERIRTIMRPQKRFYRKPSIIALIVVLLLALSIVPTSLVLTTRAKERPSSQKNVDEKPPIEVAGNERLERIRKLIDRGIDLSEGDTWGYTLLHHACMNGERQIAELLIENGADVNAKSVIGITPLHAAAGRGHADVARLLLDKNADINAADNQSATPLW